MRVGSDVSARPERAAPRRRQPPRGRVGIMGPRERLALRGPRSRSMGEAILSPPCFVRGWRASPQSNVALESAQGMRSRSSGGVLSHALQMVALVFSFLVIRPRTSAASARPCGIFRNSVRSWESLNPRDSSRTFIGFGSSRTQRKPSGPVWGNFGTV